MVDDSQKKLRIPTAQGVFVLNVDGRPDGGDSALEKYTAQQRKYAHEAPGEDFELDDDAIRELGEEALLYRLRREYFFQHEDFERARRDVLFGIDIIEFIRRHAADSEQGLFYWQFRADQEIFLRLTEAYLLMAAKDYAGARREVDQALQFVTDFYAQWDSTEAEQALKERMDLLQRKYHEIGERWENDPAALRNTAPSLEEQMQNAIAVEDYERAAAIRDKIRRRNAVTS